jgi:hypothetical protein
MSPMSVSAAATAAPTLVPAAEFSATLRAAGAVSLNTGALFTATTCAPTVNTLERA